MIGGEATLRKIGWRLLPLIALGYGLAALDRNNIGMAALQMNEDLHFSASAYGLGAGLFSVGYALCEIPSNLLLYRFGARRWIARIMFTWGLLAAGMVFIRTPLHFYVMRFLLGMAEAGFFPGVAYYLMQWFPARMRARAISRFYVAGPIAAILNGLLAGPLLGLDGEWGLRGWQWLFLVEGMPPIALSVVYWRYLTERPDNAPWLSQAEKDWISAELEADAATEHRSSDLKRTFLDPRVWQLGLLAFCLLTAAYAYILTAPAILKAATGLNAKNVGWLMSINGVLSAGGLILNAWHSDRSHERHWHIAAPALLMATAFLISGLSMRPVFLVPAFSVAIASFYSTQGVVYTMPASYLSGRSAAAGFALVGCMGILGGFAGPAWMGWLKDLTGGYQIGLMTMAIPGVLAAALSLLLRAAQSHDQSRRAQCGWSS